MNEPVTPAMDAPSDEAQPAFAAYTAFPPVEEALEQQLGDKGKLILPERYREGFVKFLPWVVLLFLPIHFAAVLLLLGVTALGTLFGSFSFGGALLSSGVFLLDVIALPGLFARTRKGWTFWVYALALGAASSLLSLSVFGLLMSVVFFWVAFQIKYQYR